MIGPVEETTIIWFMLLMNLAFLVSRLYLRRRQWEGLRVSDGLVIASFTFILTETILLTVVNMQEKNFIQWMEDHPERKFLPISEQDPVRNYLPYDEPQNVKYLKFMYASLFFNVIALWLSKFTMLAFFYEVFPSRTMSPTLRKFLYAATVYTTLTFIANLFETALWCRPHRNLWDPVRLIDFCSPKINHVFISAQFSTHLTSTLVLGLLPVILLFMHRSTGERAFALTTLFFSTISIAAATTAFVMLLKLEKYKGLIAPADPRHAATLATVADQNALFLAACLSVVRVSVRKNQNFNRRLGAEAEAESQSGVIRPTACGGGRMEIQVETTWCVDVEIVGDLGRNGGRGDRTSKEFCNWRWGVEQEPDAIRLTGNRGMH